MAEPINKDQVLADRLISQQLNIQHFTAGERRDVLRLLKTLEEELIQRLYNDDKPLTELGRADRAALLREAQELIAQHYGDVTDRALTGLDEFGRVEAEATAGAFSAAFAAKITPALPTETFFKALVRNTLIDGAPSAEWWAGQDADYQQKFANAVRQGLVAAETNAQIIARVRRDVMMLKRSQAASLVQTSVATVAAAAREEAFKQNDDLIDGYRQVSVLDSHTTLICVAYSGATWDKNREPSGTNTLPFVSANGAATGTPRHWNAVAGGEMVLTAEGEKPIENVSVGDLVMTHRGRLRPVKAVMRKRNDTGIMRVIKLETGRTIRVTDEHPVLAAGAAKGGWVRADSLKAGDKLFQYHDEPVPISSRFGVAERNPQDYPSLFDSEEVFSHVLTGTGLMASAIQLDNDLSGGESKIPHAVAKDQLPLKRDLLVYQVHAEKNLPQWKRLKLLASCIGKNALHRAGHMGWVVLRHALGMVRIVGMGLLGLAKRPMIFTAQSAAIMGGLHGQARSCSLAANFNSMTTAPAVQSGLADAVLGLNSTDGFAGSEVLTLNQVSDDSAVSQVNHFHSYSIVSINTVAHTADVFNLAVEEDETYLVDGVVVHNCRSLIVPITVTFKSLGIDLPEFRASTKAASGGPVSSKMEFDQYLQRQGKARTDEQLGKGRAELWRDGKISLQQLLDQDGRPLTLQQLKEAYNL